MTTKRPVIHLTDLYSPPEDPDDTLDLATLHALPGLDIRAVVLDPTTRFLRSRRWCEHRARARAGHRAATAAHHRAVLPGRDRPGRTADRRGDTCRDRKLGEQAGVELILSALRTSTDPVVVSVVSSLRSLVAAYNREPETCHAKIDRILLNAGSVAPEEDEWNVALDTHAYAAVWKTGLRIDRYPCGGAGGSFAREEHNTYWTAEHAPRSSPRPGSPLGRRLMAGGSFRPRATATTCSRSSRCPARRTGCSEDGSRSTATRR